MQLATQRCPCSTSAVPRPRRSEPRTAAAGCTCAWPRSARDSGVHRRRAPAACAAVQVVHRAAQSQRRPCDMALPHLGHGDAA